MLCRSGWNPSGSCWTWDEPPFYASFHLKRNKRFGCFSSRAVLFIFSPGTLPEVSFCVNCIPKKDPRQTAAGLETGFASCSIKNRIRYTDILFFIYIIRIMRQAAADCGKLRQQEKTHLCGIIYMQLNNAYEECARDKPCDRTTTCRKR